MRLSYSLVTLAIASQHGIFNSTRSRGHLAAWASTPILSSCQPATQVTLIFFGYQVSTYTLMHQAHLLRGSLPAPHTEVRALVAFESCRRSTCCSSLTCCARSAN